MADEKDPFAGLSFEDNSNDAFAGLTFEDTPQKKNLSATTTTSSVEPAKQDTKPSEENGIDKSFIYEANASRQLPVTKEEQFQQGINPAMADYNEVVRTKGNPYDFIFNQQKKAQDHYTNADAAHFDLGVINGNKKVQQAKELASQIVETSDKKTKEALTTQYQELLKQPAEDVVDNTDWEGSVNGRVVKDANVSLLKGKTVGDALDMIPAKTEELNKNVDAAKTSQTEVQDVIGKMRTAAGFSTDPGKKYKEIDWLHNYFNSAGNSIKTIVDGARWALSDDEQRKQMMRQNMVEGQVFPTKGTGSFGSELSGMIGGVTPYVIAGMGGAATAGTVGGVLSNSLTMGLSGYNSAAQEAFNEKFQETGNEDEAYKSAQTMSKVGGGMGAVEGAALSLIPGGKLPQGVRDFILKSGQKNAVLGGMFGGARFIENKIAQYEGLKRDSGSGVADSAVDGFLLGTVMDGLHYFPGKISSETKNGFENILARYAYPEVQEAVDKAVQTGIMDNASAYKTLTPIIEKANAFAKMPEMPFEKQQEVLPLMTERNKLEAEKEKSAEAFHAGIDSKIEAIDREIAEKTGAPLSEKEQNELDKLRERKANPEQGLSESQSQLHDHYTAREKANTAANTITDTPTRVKYKDGRTGLLMKNEDGDVEFIPDGNSKTVVFDKGGTVNEKSVKGLGFTVESKSTLEKPNSQIVSGEMKAGAEVVYKGKRYSIVENKNAPEGFKTDKDGNVRVIYLKDAEGNRTVVGADTADGKSLIDDANKLLGKEVKSTKLTAALDEAPIEKVKPIEEVEEKPVEPVVETPKEDVMEEQPSVEENKVEIPVEEETPQKKQTHREKIEEARKRKNEILGAEPTTVRQWIMKYFASGGKMHTDDFTKETGFGAKVGRDAKRQNMSEFRKRIWMHSKENKSNVSRMDDLVQAIKEDWLHEHGQELDDQDVRNEIIDVMNSYDKPSDILTHLREDFQDKEGNIIQSKDERMAAQMEEHYNENRISDDRAEEMEGEKLDEEKAHWIDETVDEMTDEEAQEAVDKVLEKFKNTNGEIDWVAVDKENKGWNTDILSLKPKASELLDQQINENTRPKEDAAKDGIENNPEGEGDTGPKEERQQQQERLAAAQDAFNKAEAEYNAAKKGLEEDQSAKQGDMFRGKEQKLFDDSKELTGQVAELKTKMEEAKAVLDKAQDVVGANIEGQKKLFGKDLAAEGLDDFLRAIGGRVDFIAPENKPKVIDALAKIGKGLLEEGLATMGDVMAKIKDYVLSKSKTITADDVDEIAAEVLDKINIGKITSAPLSKTTIDKAVAKKLKTETHEAGRNLIRKRRAAIDSANLKTELYALGIEKQTTKSQREVLPFILEGTGVPEKLGRPDLEKTLAEDKAKLEPIAKEIRAHFDEVWKKITENTDNLSAEQIKDYVTHIWDIPKNKVDQVSNWFATKNQFLNKRYISTIEEGVDLFGLKPKVLDIAQIIRIHDSVANTVISNNEFVKDLKTLERDGMPLMVRSDKAPEGWVTTNHPALTSTLFIPGEEGRPNSLIKLPYKVHPDLAKPIEAVFGNRINGNLLKAYENVNDVMKKVALSVSLFHHGALTETAIALMGPVKAAAAIAKLTKLGAINKGEGTPLAEFPNEALDAINDGVKFGHTLDINTDKISGMLNKFAAQTENIPGVNKATELLATANEKWDKALWNYLHDGLKLYAHMDAKTNMPENTKDPKKYMQEQSQLINDYFGGQNWDVLMVSPRTQQVMRLVMLSPDWTISKLRLAGAPAGIGAISKHERFTRAKASGAFWAKAAIYYGIGLNLLNAYQRDKDRKEHPEYYPEGDNSFMSKTMFGNTIGHKTHLFTGRYEDGSERYMRWGKEFREMPELFMDEDGVSFPKPLIKKMASKTAPLLNKIVTLTSGGNLSGFQDWDIKDKKGFDWTLGAMKVIAKGFTPMSTGNFFRDDKEWHPADLMFPSNKGMNKSQAIDLFKKGILQGDEQYVKEIYTGAVKNNLDAFGLFKTAVSSVKAEGTKELMQGIKNIDDVKEKLRSTTDPIEKRKLFNKIKQFEKENYNKKRSMQLWGQAQKMMGD